MKLNQNYTSLEESYLFSTISHRISEFSNSHPETKILRMGIGDVTLPLCSSVTAAMKQAVEDMGRGETFHGYGPEQGYTFLREKIQNYYTERSVALDIEEIFISDGAKSDLGNILDLFDKDNTVLIPDPVYPVYVDTNLMNGRQIIYADANTDNCFLPMPDTTISADIIYLCSPNNPTGAVYNKAQLTEWVNYAKLNNAVILFDAAYEAFITDPSLPRSIYEIEGARDCAIECCSLSKTAGFTGTRCGYTIVPKAIEADGMKLNKMWLRRQTTKFNGVPYIVQRGAEAVFSTEGKKQIYENIAYYRKNAELITSTLDKLNIWYTGGKNSPYIWLQCPWDMNSWDFFDALMSKTGIVGTPGAGFGKNGTNFFRLTSFSTTETTSAAMKLLTMYMNN